MGFSGIRSRVFKAGAYFCVLVIASACSHNYTSGTNFQQQDVDAIEIGKTTEADLVSHLGKPQQFTQMPGGDRQLTWVYSTTRNSSKPFWSGVLLGGGARAQTQVQEQLENANSKYMVVTFHNGTVADVKTGSSGASGGYVPPAK